jgi:hypothetical protein
VLASRQYVLRKILEHNFCGGARHREVGVAFRKCPFFKGGNYQLFIVIKEEKMKRFWLVLLSLGLIVAFSTSAMAVDVKFSGSFYAAGLYQDKTAFDGSGPSTAFYFQRLRLQTDFIVSPGLKLVTRMDIMERAWGANRFAPGTNLQGTAAVAPNNDMYSAGTTAENENIAFDYLYVEYASPIGLFRVGYQEDGAWGTVFADSAAPLGKIQYMFMAGPVVAGAYIGKFADKSLTFKNPTVTANYGDVDEYCAFALYNFKGGSAGLLWKWYSNNATRISALGFSQNEHVLLPYVKAQLGPVKVQAEVVYGFGDYIKDPNPGLGIQNSKLDDLAGWVDATVDLGMVYFGASVVYVAGDDPNTPDKKEGGFITGGADYNPALILFNFDRYYWAGPTRGYGSTANPNANDNPFLQNNDAGISNAWLVTGRVGVRPVAPLDIVATVTWATVDKKFVPPSPYVLGGAVNPVTSNGNYGTEIDLAATYKITNNLSYMLGVGYLFTGDYFKGSANNRSVVDDYLVINKLTLTF